MPIHFADAKEVAQKIVDTIGFDIRLAIPLAAGKPNILVNELYQLAKANPKIQLKIFTALSLNKPQGKTLLEKNFYGPFVDRVFKDYPNLNYEEDRQQQTLPTNVRIIEFYFQAGKMMGNAQAQQDYVSCNYTHVARDLIDQGVNVLAQMVAPGNDGQVSLSCNPDVTLDIVEEYERKGKTDFLFIGQINPKLPFMYGDATISEDRFHWLLDDVKGHHALFSPPKMAVPLVDHMIGFYASTLVKDDGELQVGIGSLGDALVSSLLLRQKDNLLYQDLARGIGAVDRFGELIEKLGGLTPFVTGLFGASEMFVDGFMHLIEKGILKKRVYDHVILQRLLNEGSIGEKVTENTLFYLLERRVISPQITESQFHWLQHFGIFKARLDFKDGYAILENGDRLELDLNEDNLFRQVIQNCLGSRLKNGAVVHGGFYLGCNAFYDWLRALPEEEKRKIHMKSVRKINQLYGHEALDRLHRKNARFVNTCLMMTLTGGAASDGLADGRVISGVGGQYNFVAMAHELEGGRSIIQLRSTRMKEGEVCSNIVFNYGNITIPRHLRDIVITEYGIADLRGKTDSEVAASLIEIADSRFQEKLIKEAQAAKKLSKNYRLPENCKNNSPEDLMRITKPFRDQGLFKAFPFGTELTDVEIRVGRALKSLKKKSQVKAELVTTLAKAAAMTKVPEQVQKELERMNLDKPKNFREKFYARLLAAELMKA
ncbi:MAG: hypothetical protein KDD33_13255 [Bdellovibrionales bacterium]|nr:hypothetical protein [Bdellovibrionales bacterium]